MPAGAPGIWVVVVLATGAGAVVDESDDSRHSLVVFAAVGDGVLTLDHESRILASAKGILKYQRKRKALQLADGACGEQDCRLLCTRRFSCDEPRRGRRRFVGNKDWPEKTTLYLETEKEERSELILAAESKRGSTMDIKNHRRVESQF